jgi:hypothetical protein
MGGPTPQDSKPMDNSNKIDVTKGAKSATAPTTKPSAASSDDQNHPQGGKKVMGEEEEQDEDLVEENMKKMKTKMKEDIDALFAEDANLSEDFKSKAATIFEARVLDRVQQLEEEIESRYAEMLDEAVTTIKDDLTAKVDDYLNYVVLRKHIKKETVGPEQLKQFQTKLVGFFRDGYNKYFNESNEPASDDVILDFINKQLIEHGIIISGGFVLKNLGYIKSDKEASSVDIDMYIPGNTPLSTYVLFGKLFNANIDETTNNGTATNDKSIMNRFEKVFYDVKNARKWQLKGIRSVTKFKRGIKDTPSYGEMDFVRAYATKTDKHPLRTPEQIVNDFDLTFCENWYDGKNVYITHKKAILKEEPGFLKSTYLFSYLLGKNRMSVSRVKKYIQRGFRIIFVDPRKEGHDTKNPYKIMEIKYKILLFLI